MKKNYNIKYILWSVHICFVLFYGLLRKRIQTFNI